MLSLLEILFKPKHFYNSIFSQKPAWKYFFMLAIIQFIPQPLLYWYAFNRDRGSILKYVGEQIYGEEKITIIQLSRLFYEFIFQLLIVILLISICLWVLLIFLKKRLKFGKL